MEDTTKEIVYFRYCGEVNTARTLRLARERCRALRITDVVIASETGRSALQALDAFGEAEARLVVVTHYPATTWGPRGDIPIGLKREEYAEARESLRTGGAAIVQGSRPFAPPSRSLDWDYPTPEGVVDRTLEVLGAGTKIAIEVALMATDAGAIDEGEQIISCAGTFKGLDTALVVRATHTMNFFADFEVREIIARPRYRVRELPEYEYQNWKGDLDTYYEREQAHATGFDGRPPRGEDTS